MAATTAAAAAALLAGKAAMRPAALAARKAAAAAATPRDAWQTAVLLAGRRAFSQDAAAQATGKKADRTLGRRLTDSDDSRSLTQLLAASVDACRRQRPRSARWSSSRPARVRLRRPAGRVGRGGALTRSVDRGFVAIPQAALARPRRRPASPLASRRAATGRSRSTLTLACGTSTSTLYGARGGPGAWGPAAARLIDAFRLSRSACRGQGMERRVVFDFVNVIRNEATVGQVPPALRAAGAGGPLPRGLTVPSNRASPPARRTEPDPGPPVPEPLPARRVADARQDGADGGRRRARARRAPAVV